MESLEYLLRAVVIETNTCDRGGMETEEIRLTNLRTPGGIGIEDYYHTYFHGMLLQRVCTYIAL